jgi:putative MATE family efflux protein
VVLPSILAFALAGVYSIVDGFFVGQKLGDPGLAAVTVGYPLAVLIQAVGTGLGMAGAIRYTMWGAQNKGKEQQECYTASLILLTLVSVVLTVLFLKKLYPIVHFLGGEGEILKMTADYVQMLAMGTIFQLLSTGLIPFIRNMGGSTYAMVSMILGFVTNILLDYVLVWVIPLGMTGAALATVIGQAVTMAAAVLYLLWKKERILFPRGTRMLRIGIAPFGMTISPMVTLVLMNRFLQIYGGEQAVAVYGCIDYVTAVAYMLLQGVGDGSQPLISECCGEGDENGAKTNRRLAYQTAGVITAACILGLGLSRHQIGRLFGASEGTAAEAAVRLPLFLGALIFISFTRVTSAYCYAVEQVILSYVLVYAEPILSVCAMLVIPPVRGLEGVWCAIPAAQAVTGVIALGIKRTVDRRQRVRRE